MNWIRSLWPFLVVIIAYGLDRFSKWWAADFLARNGAVELNAFFSIKEAYNRGIAFGMLQGIGPLVGWLTILVVLALTIFMVRLPAGANAMKFGLSLLIGGALGNMWDRIIHGEVLDFIVSPIRPGIFNIADVLIYVGIGICCIAAMLPEPPNPEPLSTTIDS